MMQDIVGERVMLRVGNLSDDEDTWFRWLNLAEWQYYDEPDAVFKPMSREAFDSKRRPATSPISPQRMIDTLAGEWIGWVGSYGFNTTKHSIFVGVDLPEEHTWNQGYGTEAICLWIDYLFRDADLALNEIRTATWTGNKRMMRCAEKCGFEDMILMPHRAEKSVRGEPLERAEFILSRATWQAKKGE